MGQDVEQIAQGNQILRLWKLGWVLSTIFREKMGHWNWILGQVSARVKVRNKVEPAVFRSGAWRVPRPLAMGLSSSPRASEAEPEDKTTV